MFRRARNNILEKLNTKISNMRNIELTESDCSFVHYVLRMYATQTANLDDQDKSEIREVAAKFK
jgi:hypothetical protein